MWSPTTRFIRHSANSYNGLQSFDRELWSTMQLPDMPKSPDVWRTQDSQHYLAFGARVVILNSSDWHRDAIATWARVPHNSKALLRAGWPCESFASSMNLVTNEEVPSEFRWTPALRVDGALGTEPSLPPGTTGWLLNEHLAPLARVDRSLPLGVLLFGMLVGSLFWAGVIAGPILATRLVRRYRRVLRGRCPACAYPNGVGPRCTECGEKLPLGSGGRSTADGT